MDSLQIFVEICGICESLIHIVGKQRETLAQLDAVVLEDEIEQARSRYNAVLGSEEWPKETDREAGNND